MRLRRFFTIAANLPGVLHERRLPRLAFMFAQAPSPAPLDASAAAPRPASR
jgi:hypothetical protein